MAARAKFAQCKNRGENQVRHDCFLSSSFSSLANDFENAATHNFIYFSISPPCNSTQIGLCLYVLKHSACFSAKSVMISQRTC